MSKTFTNQLTFEELNLLLTTLERNKQQLIFDKSFIIDKGLKMSLHLEICDLIKLMQKIERMGD